MLDGVETDGLCLEKRVFYRLISGLHTSITVQVCANHYKPAPGGLGTGTWSHNTDLFKARFSEEATNGEGPERLKNLYFVWLLELRAIAKAAPYLKESMFYTGNAQEDKETREAVKQLLAIAREFPEHFDERQMFQGHEGARSLLLREEFRQHFINVSRIMDCVSCDKCRLWGKLNVHGMGTALKILFSKSFQNGSFQLQRNDVVALFNSLGRYSDSIREVAQFRQIFENAAASSSKAEL